ncbi:uncharacterized protein LOC133794746 [Humulus lupulus]|uniref:uncharacterized protein LOC133794746 n=1 Tax=Humulus lupulus TaxID=3486 RepID=UPI002B408741|nr:uncharacterized protein LOC133794746 [Humulus lupulus]
MDEIHENQKLQSCDYGDRYAIVAKSNNKYQYLLRRTLQIVVSVSILSLFYGYFIGVSFFPHSFSVYFSTFLFSLFTRTLERKYMFLICNGILAFLAKTSVSGDYISSHSDQTTLPPTHQSSTVTTKAAAVVEDHDQVESSTDDVVFEEDGEETTAQNEQVVVPHQRQRADLVDDQQVKSDNDHNKEIPSLMNSTTSFNDENNIDKDDDDDDQGNGGGSDYFLSKQEANNYDEELISTDELNKKIEEFIRKMKEEIRVEAQQQPIAV